MGHLDGYGFAIGATSEDPKAFGKAIIFVALGEGVALYGMQNAYWICLPCFIYILYYALTGHKIRTK